ncbi:hypothetical protein HC028_23480 [Planosporangium flavigriseum]|uniref:Uncharacterized protein n=1 Tax=Planosporangium flavigriseum TaxID=373681 RepID=A0A8J3LLK8_9ACTN|nr:hypothetical protein [Planosporangium flavigriseum]NJC67437.1 hypothetical protein [Planosporangium flavigriseum]GIG74922.1 hypothetical protein Pfl04_33260 [Planosporangium flavigriseum]
MSERPDLPASLAPWAPALSTLTIDVALAMGPLVRHIDKLLSGADGSSASHGQPDGYAGLTSHGDVERLLPSQLLLAQELPEEFVRRAATGELLYLAPAFQSSAVRGRVAALVDTGPAQLGATRLVQLAALVVLHRRAIAQGRSLVVGMLGERPGYWRNGGLTGQLDAWLAARRAAEPTSATVREWMEQLDAADEAWLLTGPELAGQLSKRHRVLVSREQEWGIDGATTVRISVGERRIDLSLPDHDIALRVLRGAGFQRATVPASAGAGPLRAPLFPSTRPYLVARGEGPAEIVSFPVPTGRPRRHRLPGPVLGASWLGRRLVVLTCVDQTLRAVVIGKPLGRLHQLAVPLAAIGMSIGDAEAAAEPALSPLYFHAGDLLCEIGGVWWRLSTDDPPLLESFAAVAPGQQVDQPRMAWRINTAIRGDVPRGADIPADAQLVLGPGDSGAWTVDATTWNIYTPPGVVHHVTVPDGAKVVGLATIDGPRLVTLSSGGLIVRLVSPTQTRVLTRWSGGVAEPALHPSQPWLAVPRPDGLIEVADLASNQLLCTIRSGE